MARFAYGVPQGSCHSRDAAHQIDQMRLFVRVAIGLIAGLLGPAAVAAPAQTIQASADVMVPVRYEGRWLVYPHLAMNPMHPEHVLMAAVLADPSGESSRRNCVSAVSFDAGDTWESHEFPISDCSDPWVAITPEGEAVFTALGRDPNLPQQGRTGLVLYHSADGGRTWNEYPVGLGDGHDRQTLVTDVTLPERSGWLYLMSSRVTRTDAGGLLSNVYLTRSRDGGRTFDAPVSIQVNNLFHKAETAVVLSDGTLVTLLVQPALGDGRTLLGSRRAWVMRSSDHGATFSVPMFVDESCGPAPDQPFAISALVANGSAGPFRDRLYFVCNLKGGDGVVLRYSTDAGETWSSPRTVHSSPADTLTLGTRRQFRAAAVNEEGVVGVAYVEFSTPGGECYDVYFAASTDGGASFLPEKRISTRTSCPDGSRWGGGGAWWGMTTDEAGRFRLLWSDAREGRFHLRTSVVKVDRSLSGVP